MAINQSSLFIDVHGDRVHVRKIAPEHPASVPPILLVHGAMENGRIFYTHSNKGLAPFLATAGFTCYIPDFRGHGDSAPQLTAHQGPGQFDLITQDFPAFMAFVQAQHTGQPVHLIAHSWGGVIAACACARGLVQTAHIKHQIFMGTKRSIRQRNLKRWFLVSAMWGVLLPLFSRVLGYVPMKFFGMGSDNETQIYLQETLPWLNGAAWRDSVDGFDYAQAASQIHWPPTWTMTGINDKILGHPDDVLSFAAELFVTESSTTRLRTTILGKSTGYAQDYDHINLLTAKAAVSDHFPEILDFLQTQGG